jgi:glutamate---cysteine ligase / carboxylate-amine ligase
MGHPEVDADQATRTGLSFGVEEEFLLVDPATGTAVGRAPDVLARAGGEPGRAPDFEIGLALKVELNTSQVEAATGVCTTLDELRSQLVEGRRRLAAAAKAEGLWLVSAGRPVLASPRVRPNEGERFDRIATSYAGVVADYETCGCHVHVGIPDRDTAVAVVNHVTPWLPTLLALSGNSPFLDGRDTGYASWRIIEQSRFPGSGLTPWAASAAEYDARVARLVECGALVDDHMSFWFARPSERYPTVELRAADAMITTEESTLQAALSRALVRTALRDLDRGRAAQPAFGSDAQIAAAAVWSAARYGLDGPGVHPFRHRKVPATQLVDELLAHVAEALEDTGDLTAVHRTIAKLTGHDTGDGTPPGLGADRQRAAAAQSGPLGAVRMLAEHTVPSESCNSHLGPSSQSEQD